jgi:hypothetical protein
MSLAFDELGRASVGMSGTIRDLVLPGSELEVAPVTRASVLILRIDAVRPHGDAFRYDFSWYGLEPGSHALAPYLVRKDGSSTAGLPEHTFTVTSLLAPGQVEPHRPGAGGLPRLGGYQALLIFGAILWCAGLVWILARFRRRTPDAAPGSARRISLAERLRPLVAAARANELSPAGRAELELALLAFWRKRLGLSERDPVLALRELRAHAEAGPLLQGLEDWLHRPDPPAVDLEQLLAPYADLPAEALELPELAEAAR